jgi:hypothetical protein
MEVLSMIVMWTRLPPGSSGPRLALQCQVDRPCNGVSFDVQSTSAANRGWLDALLHHQLPINFYIQQGSHLGSLVAALKRCRQPVVITPWRAVEAGVLGGLLAAYAGQQLTIDMWWSAHVGSLRAQLLPDDAREGDVQSRATMLEALQAADEHSRAAPLPNMAKLNCLDIRDCRALHDSDLREVVGRLGAGLTKLCLSDAQHVRDSTLWALLRSCGQLQRLELSGAPSVTEDGLAPLLVVLQPSFSASLSGTGVNWSELERKVRGQGVCCGVDQGGGNGSVVNVFCTLDLNSWIS